MGSPAFWYIPWINPEQLEGMTWIDLGIILGGALLFGGLIWLVWDIRHGRIAYWLRITKHKKKG